MHRPIPLALQAIVLVVLLPAGTASAAPDASGPFRHVVELARTIGPRPTGSEADGRAVDYVRHEMESAGLTVSLQEVSLLQEENGERRLQSWNVVGRLAGATPETIIVAAHHDSRGPQIPGAADDASGIAILLEAARAAAARPHLLTYLFIAFGAEEDGLLGSRRFARDADLSRVRAVIALELLGRGEILVGPVPEPPPLWAQRALLKAGRESGVRSVAARPLWTLAPRFLDLPFSADHEPFLRRGIPAFLLLGTFPAWTYHTSEDTLKWIDPAALARAATVLDRLLRDLEAAPPGRDFDPHYLPFTLFGRGFVVTTPALLAIAWGAIAASALLSLSRLRTLASARGIMETVRVLIVTTACTSLGLSGLFLSSTISQRIHQVRFPWMAHQSLHVAQGIVGALLTGWLGLKLFRSIKPTINPGPYFAGALLLSLLPTAAALRMNRPELAAMGAASACGFLLSRLTRTVARKLALGLLGLAPLCALLTLDDYRATVDLGGIAIPGPYLFGALLAVALPFVLFVAHVSCFQDCLQSPVWRRLSGRWVGGGALAVFAILLGITASLPAYDATHRQVVAVRQRVDLDDRQATVRLFSYERLRGLHLGSAGDGRDLDEVETRARLPAAFPEGHFTFDSAALTQPEGDSTVVSCSVSLKAPVRPAQVDFVFTSRSGFRVPERDQSLRRSYSFVEVAPAGDLARTFRLLVPPGGDLTVSMRADFDADLLGVDPSGAGQVFVQEGRVTASRHLLGDATPPAAASTFGAAR